MLLDILETGGEAAVSHGMRNQIFWYGIKQTCQTPFGMPLYPKPSIQEKNMVETTPSETTFAWVIGASSR